MDIFMGVVLSLAVAAFVFAVVMLIQNQRVYNYRTRLLQEIYDAAGVDIKNGNYDWQWRYDMYSAVDYNEMATKFWKPLDSFYPEREKMVTPK